MKQIVIKSLMLTLMVLSLCFMPISAEAAENVYDVTDYGANGSDSSSDRYAIQSVLDRAKNTSGKITVFIPDGTYYIDYSLVIYSDTTLKLSDNAIIKKIGTNQTNMLTNAADDGAAHGKYDQSKNITVTGGTWDGKMSNPTKEMNLLYFGHAQNITIKNTTIKNCYGAHLLELTGVKDATVSNVTFAGFTSTGKSEDDAVKEALQIDVVTEETSEHYAPYDSTPCANIKIEKCSFNNYPCAIGSHTIVKDTVGVTIDSCTFSNISNNVIQMNQYSDVVITKNVLKESSVMPLQFLQFVNCDGEISNNTITGTTDDSIYLNNSIADIKKNNITSSGLYPIYIANNSSVVIEENVISDTPKNGIHLASGTATVNKNTISDCTGCAVYALKNTSLKADGNKMSNCGDFVIGADAPTLFHCTNNTINNKDTYGIFVTNANANTLIKGNTVVATGDFGITLQGATSSVIDGNNVSGYKEYGIYIRESASGSYASKVTIQNNEVSDGKAGVSVRKAKATTIKNNTISNSSVCSIYVADTCSNSVVKDNSIGNELGVYDTSATVSGNKGYVKVEVKKASDGNWYYYENGKINYSFNGLAENSSGLWKIEKGKVNFGFNDLYQYNDVWYYIKGGEVNFDYTGLTNSSYGWWYINKGILNFDYTGLTKYNNSWWYVKDGHLTFDYDGVAKNDGKYWYIENSQVDFSKNGLLSRGNWYYFKGGAVDSSYTGLAKNAHGWWYINKGELNFNYTGLTKYNNSWWYVKDGHLTFDYDGVAKNDGKYWYIENSQVDFSKNGLLSRGNWYYFKGGAVDTSYTGLTKNAYGWWYINKGELNFNYTGLTNYNNSWWYVADSHLTFDYDGVAKNDGKYWYIENSQVDFSKNGLKLRAGKWYLFKDGAVNQTTTVAYNDGSWWYVKNGVVDFNYSGKVSVDGKTYTIKNGRVV